MLDLNIVHQIESTIADESKKMSGERGLAMAPSRIGILSATAAAWSLTGGLAIADTTEVTWQSQVVAEKAVDVPNYTVSAILDLEVFEP